MVGVEMGVGVVEGRGVLFLFLLFCTANHYGEIDRQTDRQTDR